MNNTFNIKKFLPAVGLAIVGSVVGNVLLTMIGRKLSAPPETFGPYLYSSVIFLTVIGIILAGVVYALLRRKFPVSQANNYFVVLSVVGLFASFYPDIMLPSSLEADDIGWTYGIIVNLMLMHVVAVACIIYFFVRISGSEGEGASQ